MIGKFYAPFHENVDKTLRDTRPTNAERRLGDDPKTGKPVIARIGRYGPMVQLGGNDDEKKQFASLQKGQLIESITMEDALKLFELPRTVGTYDGMEIVASTGRFGPYVRFGDSFASLKKGDSPYTVTLEQAIELIDETRRKDIEKFIKSFDREDVQVLNGHFGPYIAHDGRNYKIPKNTDHETLTLETCLSIIEAQKDKAGGKPAPKQWTTAKRKTTTKKKQE